MLNLDSVSGTAAPEQKTEELILLQIRTGSPWNEEMKQCRGSGGPGSRSQETEVRNGDLAETSLSTPFGQAGFLALLIHCKIPPANSPTSSSSTVVLHFSRLIRLTAHFSLRGLQTADCTTAVAPEPATHQRVQLFIIGYYKWNLHCKQSSPHSPMCVPLPLRDRKECRCVTLVVHCAVRFWRRGTQCSSDKKIGHSTSKRLFRMAIYTSPGTRLGVINEPYGSYC